MFDIFEFISCFNLGPISPISPKTSSFKIVTTLSILMIELVFKPGNLNSSCLESIKMSVS